MDERIDKLLGDPKIVAGVVSAVCFGAGLGLGYLLGKRRGTTTVVMSRADAEIERNKAVADYEAITELYNKPTSLIISAEELSEFKAEYDLPDLVLNDTVIEVKTDEIISVEEVTTTLFVDNTEITTTVQNVFAHDDSDWNHSVELSKRNPDRPYILHKDEFYEETDHDLNQVSLTYYAGDDFMVDENFEPILNYSTIVGELRFGHGSQDRDIVYVRNEKRKAEYEITLDPGLYTVEVLGLEIEDNARVKELKHAKTPRFRQEP